MTREYHTGLYGQFSWLFSARIAGLTIQALNLALLARLAGPRNFGHVTAVMGIAAALSALSDFGVGAYLTKSRAVDPLHPDIGPAVRLNSYTACTVGGAFTLCMLIAESAWPYFTWTWPLGIWLAGEKYTEARLAIALADGDTRENALSVLTRRGLAFLVLLLLVYIAHGSPVPSFTVAHGVSACLGALAAQRRLGDRLPANKAGSLTVNSAGNAFSIVRRSWPFWLNTAAAQFRNLDVLVVSLFAGPAVAGVYAVPSRLTSPLRMFPTTLAQIALPAATRMHTNGKRQLFRATIGSLGIMGLILTAVGVSAPTIVRILGESYTPAIAPLRIVCVGLFAASAASLMSSILQGMGWARHVAFSSTVTSLSALAMIAYGSLNGGASGAAVGLAASYLLQALLLSAPFLLERQSIKRMASS